MYTLWLWDCRSEWFPMEYIGGNGGRTYFRLRFSVESGGMYEESNGLVSSWSSTDRNYIENQTRDLGPWKRL
jgi:hypothetical protein